MAFDLSSRPAILAASLALLAAACGGGKEQGGGELASAGATGAAQWRLSYSVEQAGEEAMQAAPAGGGEGVTSTHKYNFTCRGEGLLAPENDEGTDFSGPVTLDCTYRSSSSFDTPVWRETMSGAGIADAADASASLTMDTERGHYGVSLPVPAWTVVQTHKGETCQAVAFDKPCQWTPYTKVDSTGVNGDRVTLRELPLPAGGAAMSGASAAPPEMMPNTTRRVTWTLTPAGTRKKDDDDTELAVEIDGPACACLEGEKVPGARVTWIARASRSGGTFAPFTVQPQGVAPKVVENGGGSGTITLEPARATGAVTLTATYTRDGKTAAATREVSFCVLDSIGIGDGSRDMSFDDATPGVLAIRAQARGYVNGMDATPELAWRFAPIGDAATTKLSPEHAAGGVVDVAYTGLPELNTAFGPKQIEVALRKGACDCTRRDTFRAFYSPSARNHPAPGGTTLGEAPVPNWFYYYAQTPAIEGTAGVRYAKVRLSSTGQKAIAQFDETDGNIYLTDQLWAGVCRPAVPRGGKPVALPDGGSAGIDCVAESVRHEDQHRVDFADWWPDGVSNVSDFDLDGVPNAIEDTLPGCSKIDQTSCHGRPFIDVSDREINAYWVGWQWKAGSVDAQDWACGRKGKQWKDGYGCAE